MPRKLLKTLSNIKACKGASTLPFGAGMRFTIACKISSIPMPALAACKQNIILFAANQFY